jgi:flagellar protein FliO/FliZ
MFCLNAGAATSADDRTDEAIVQAAEKLMKEGATTVDVKASAPATATAAAATETPDTATKAEAKESDIPLFLDAKKSDKSMGSVAWRLVASLVLIATVGGGMIYASRRWARAKDKGGSKARIEMMHQFHMGPRKSLALIRVSGETMLIGVTDHNINMIKSVALIDDELEGVMNKDFNNFLEDEFSIEDVRSALNSRA